MGIKVTTETKAIASLKLANEIRSYLFEQQYNELKDCKESQIESIRKAVRALDRIVKNSKK